TCVDAFVQDHDLLPTLLDILKIRRWAYLEEQVNGSDAFPLITRESEQIRNWIICGYEVYTCVRDYDWHYIISDQWEDPPVRFWRGRRLPRGEWLFDLNDDPECENNVADDYTDEARRMKDRLKNLLNEYGITDVPMNTYQKYPKKGFFALSSKKPRTL
ncbi:MAG: hypothetical protein OEZ24_02780, partial [Candidatus Bathyarchaeota archaeon]|nr:hypothetical protein [Candidatus Bathyarchaeota archaeon]